MVYEKLLQNRNKLFKSALSLMILSGILSTNITDISADTIKKEDETVLRKKSKLSEPSRIEKETKESKKDTKQDSKITSEWKLEANTDKWVYYENNKPATNKWIATKDGWYYTDENGEMVTKPIKIDGKWEYFNRFGRWYNEYEPLNVVYDTGYNQAEANKILNEINNLPKYLKYLIEEVRFTPNSLEEEFNLARTGTILAVTHKNNKIVFRTGTGISTDNLAEHEAYHVFSNMVWQDATRIQFERMVSDCDEWMGLIGLEGNAIPVSIYNQRNSHEIFVEAALMYRYEPNRLKNIAPNIYEFLDEKVFIYK